VLRDLKSVARFGGFGNKCGHSSTGLHRWQKEFHPFGVFAPRPDIRRTAMALLEKFITIVDRSRRDRFGQLEPGPRCVQADA
jgi:hypothetical protein